MAHRDVQSDWDMGRFGVNFLGCFFKSFLWDVWSVKVWYMLK